MDPISRRIIISSPPLHGTPSSYAIITSFCSFTGYGMECTKSRHCEPMISAMECIAAAKVATCTKPSSSFIRLKIHNYKSISNATWLLLSWLTVTHHNYSQVHLSIGNVRSKDNVCFSRSFHSTAINWDVLWTTNSFCYNGRSVVLFAEGNDSLTHLFAHECLNQ